MSDGDQTEPVYKEPSASDEEASERGVVPDEHSVMSNKDPDQTETVFNVEQVVREERVQEDERPNRENG